jgi:acyl carrier protein
VVRSFLENQGASGSEEARSLASEAEALLEERFESRRFEVRLRPLSEILAEQRIERVGLLKLNAEKSELEVLRGIREEDWGRIDQAVVEVDLREHLAPVVSLFETHGFQVLVDQDPLLARTDLHYLYAARKGSGRVLAPGAPAPAPPSAPAEVLTSEALRTYLARWLPDPMIPSAWAFLEAMPLTANGKLDRARLPEPEARSRAYEAPRGDLERRIAEIWAEALGLERVGAHDNFFDLGGHSLLLARVHTALRRKLATEISIVELFRFPTVASLAQRLSEEGGAQDAVKGDRQRGARRRGAAGARARSRAAAEGAQA